MCSSSSTNGYLLYFCNWGLLYNISISFSLRAVMPSPAVAEWLVVCTIASPVTAGYNLCIKAGWWLAGSPEPEPPCGNWVLRGQEGCSHWLQLWGLWRTFFFLFFPSFGQFLFFAARRSYSVKWVWGELRPWLIQTPYTNTYNITITSSISPKRSPLNAVVYVACS